MRIYSKRITSITGATAMAMLLTASLFSGAAAQQSPSPDQCYAAFTGLDSNADKQLTDDEIREYDKGDANNDGRITNDEFMKACEAGLFRAMTPN